MNQYEAMFLFDPTFGATFESCETEIRRLMDRAEAELVFCHKWDDRRLAYRIKGRKRGVYVLIYFKAKAEKIVPLERDAQLSEDILRLLVLRADDVTPEAMERATALGSVQADGENGPPDHRRRDAGPRPAPPPAPAPAKVEAPKPDVVETATTEGKADD